MNFEALQTPIAVLSAVLLDSILGEPKRFHPLVGFGQFANLLESKLNANHPSENSVDISQKKTQHAKLENLKGAFALALALVPFVCVSAFLQNLPFSKFVVGTIFLYLAIGASSLTAHAEAIASALDAQDITLARQKVSYIVSRDTSALDAESIARAGIESVLENGSDAVFAAIFWFVVGGAPAVVLYRLSNTLDAMWGYKNERFSNFGWAAARFDDCLNYIPARLTALTYSALGNWQNAIRCWRTQAKQWYSPNAGPVMSAGAGALSLKLGGAAVYHGKLKERPVLGSGANPSSNDIRRATVLVNRGIYLWVILFLLIGVCKGA